MQQIVRGEVRSIPSEQEITVCGGEPLRGTVCVGGSRTVSEALLAASVLATENVTIQGIAQANDAKHQAAHLATLGFTVQEGSDDTLHVSPPRTFDAITGRNLTGRAWATLLLIGPMLARAGQAIVPLPGPSETGPRAIDLHLKGFSALGAQSKIEGGFLHLEASRLQGADIFLDYPSLSATLNIMMAATGAVGRTVIRHAARNPEAVDVATFLITMGARIRGAGTDVITIDGGYPLRGTTHRVLGDRHEAAFYLAAALATGGRVSIEGVEPLHLLAYLAKLEEIGAAVSYREATIQVAAPQVFRSTVIRALPYPGFSAEWYLLLAPILARAAGTSIISDAVSPDRMLGLEEMRRLGVKAVIEPGVAVLHGERRLTGTLVEAYGPHSASALLIALLAAEGEGILAGAQNLSTHYPNSAARLLTLGAQLILQQVEVRP